MYLLYSALLAAGLLISLPYWLFLALAQGKCREGFGERLGRVPARLMAPKSQPVIWTHAVSVGEVMAVSGLVAEMKRQWPRYRVVVSTTTDTGQKLARARFGQENVFYFPLDFAFAVRPYLRALRPELIVLAETEFWPNFLRLSHDSGAGIAVVNARISDRSWPGYRRWRRLLRRVLRPVDIFLTQSEEDRQRLIEIGAAAKRVQVSGNLKFDAALPAEPPIAGQLRKVLQQERSGPVLVCGSTVEGEELLLLQAFRDVLAKYSCAVMLLAPRHPERFPQVGQMLQESQLPFRVRSAWRGEPISGSVLLIDSIGELAALYGLGDLAFVGGSLVRQGGHNILEPALHGVATVVGPYTGNFRDVVSLFQRRHAVTVVQAAQLSPVFIALLADDAERTGLGRRAADTVRAQQGATLTTTQALKYVLERSTGLALPSQTS
jgi:3-deoxy-D-manno-octulosonic-acid transferase